MYQVRHLGGSIEENVSRDEAIKKARKLSQKNHGQVVVQDEDELERLTYINGSLMTYSYDTRRR